MVYVCGMCLYMWCKWACACVCVCVCLKVCVIQGHANSNLISFWSMHINLITNMGRQLNLIFDIVT